VSKTGLDRELCLLWKIAIQLTELVDTIPDDLCALLEELENEKCANDRLENSLVGGNTQ